MILNINIDIDINSIESIFLADEVNTMITNYLNDHNVFQLAEIDSKFKNILKDSKYNKVGIIQAKIKENGVKENE